MDSNISSSIIRASFLVRLNGTCTMYVPQGAIEQIIVSALSAGTDISILSVDNDCYKLKL